MTTKSILSVVTFALAGVLLGCGDDPKIKLPSEANGSSSGSGGSDDFGPDAMAPVASCDGAPKGTPCGKSSQQTHCIFDACVKNACGDGVPAFGEKCDDGNERDGDGCDSRCKLEVAPGCGNGVLEPGEECDDGNTSDADSCTADCKNPRCGDGVLSAGEECDDGNVSNGDSCTNKCKKAPVLCGNGVKDADEECDDGNTMDGDECDGDCTLPPVCGDGDVEGDEDCDDGNTMDGDACNADCTLPHTGGSGGTGSGGTGSGGTGSGGAGSGGTGGSGTGGDDEDAGMMDGGDDGSGGSGGDNPACDACREANCHVYFSGAMDAVAGCFDSGSDGATARSAWTNEVFTPAQVQQCVDAVDCAHAHGCGLEDMRPAAGCYCGPMYPNNGKCSMAPATGATAPDGVCKAEFEAAVGLASPASPTTVMARIGSVDFPAGWAYNLLGCEVSFCLTECSH